VDRIGARRHRRNQRVTGLVVGSVLFLFVGKNHGPPLDAHHHLIFGHLEVGHHDELAVLPRRPQRCFVHKVCKVGTGETGRPARDDGKIDVIADGHLARMNAKNLFATLHIGTGDNDAAVKAARPKQSRVENVGAVRRGN